MTIDLFSLLIGIVEGIAVCLIATAIYRLYKKPKQEPINDPIN